MTQWSPNALKHAREKGAIAIFWEAHETCQNLDWRSGELHDSRLKEAPPSALLLHKLRAIPFYEQ